MNVTVSKGIKTDDCRVCLSSNENNKFIYSTTIIDEYDNCEVGLKEILQRHGGIELAENDGLPSCICQECFFKVHTANKLWEQCQLTNRKLQAIHKEPERKQLEFNSQLVTVEPCQSDDSIHSPTHQTNNQQSPGIAMNRNISAKLSTKISSRVSTQIQNDDTEAENNLCVNKPRRLSMFKRITSMKNLTDNKTRQRNYLKNNRNPTLKSDDISHDENSDNGVMNTEVKRQLSPQYQCSQCDRKYSTKKTLYRHCLTHDIDTKTDSCDIKPISQPVCSICKKVFRKTTTMIKHLNIHKKTHPTDVLNILQRLKTERKFLCSTNKTSLSNNSLKNHKKTRMKEKVIDPTEQDIPRNPPDPETAIILINTLIKEELSTNDNKNKEYCCSVCGKFYSTKKSLLKHNRDKHEMKMKEIRIESRKGNIDNKAENQSKEFQCNECNKTFQEKMQFQRHMKVHDKNKKKSSVDRDINFKRFLCHICSKTFRQNTGLMFHMRTHTGYKPHECRYCGRGFTSNSNCINHERTHTGDRPFVCHFCSAAFAKSCTLKSHITTHTGEANYHCKTCGKSFRRLKYLKEHKFTHTGEKPYACKICGTAYSHSGSLFVHEKKCKAQLNNQPTTTTTFHPQIHSKPDEGTVFDKFNNSLDPLATDRNSSGSVIAADDASDDCNNITKHSVNNPMPGNAIQNLPIPNQMFGS